MQFSLHKINLAEIWPVFKWTNESWARDSNSVVKTVRAIFAKWQDCDADVEGTYNLPPAETSFDGRN